jgi:hypothetical protein
MGRAEDPEELMPTPLDRFNPVPWLATLSVTDAPMTRAGVATALRFFASRMPLLSQADQLSFLRGMDLHSPVRELTLAPPAVLAAFRYSSESAFKLFYTKAGTSPQTLGINPGGRVFRRFRVVMPAVVLESRCTAARQTWTDPDSRQAFEGGGLQFVVPNAERVLVLVP